MKKVQKNQGLQPKKDQRVWGKGPINLMGAELDCYILMDGTPLLNKGKMMKAIGRQWKGSSRTEMPNFIGAHNLQAFIVTFTQSKRRLLCIYSFQNFILKSTISFYL